MSTQHAVSRDESAVATMSILHVAYSNAAGVPGRYVEAHASFGAKAELLIEVADGYGYGAEAAVVRWSRLSRWPDEPEFGFAMAKMEAADALMVYDSPWHLERALQVGKPVIFRAYGSHSRNAVDWVSELLRSEHVVRATAGTGDLALLLDLPFVGCPYPLLPPATREQLVAVHSPSVPELKGTTTIEHACARTGWELEVVTDTSNREVLQRKRRAALVIDQFGDPPHPDGLGIAGIEAMAMGLPVIGRASPEVREVYRRTGCPALLVTTQDELDEALDQLHDASLRDELGVAGRKWVASFHNPHLRALEDMHALVGSA